MLERIIKYLIDLCCVYTIVSLSGAIVNSLAGTETNNFNVFLMLATCAIATFVLHLHVCFSEVSPLVMIIIQYLVACVLCAAMILVIGIFTEPLSARGWFEYYRSFTIPYVILAGLYYFKVFSDAKKQNALIQEIREQKKAYRN